MILINYDFSIFHITFLLIIKWSIVSKKPWEFSLLNFNENIKL